MTEHRIKVKKYKPGVMVTGYDPSIKCWWDRGCQDHVLTILTKAKHHGNNVWAQDVQCMVCFKYRKDVLVRWLRQKATPEDIERALRMLEDQRVTVGSSISRLTVYLRKISV